MIAGERQFRIRKQYFLSRGRKLDTLCLGLNRIILSKNIK